MSLHWYVKFWAFTFWTCRPKLSVEWHWLQICLSQIFLYFGQFYLYSKQACKQIVSQLDSHHRYIHIQWICKECKAWFWLLKNGHMWLETSPVVLKFILLFFHFVVCNCLFAKNSHSHSAIGENDRMLSTICVFKEFWFSSRNLCRLTCDLGSLSLLSNRADSLVTSVSPQVRNCGEPPDRLRSEISFLRTCNIPNLISHIHRIALPKRFTGCVSTWLWNCMRTEANICSM